VPYSVLVVDDDGSIRDLLELWFDDDTRFTMFGTAPEGGKALDMVQTSCPDAIVCDINMPGMNGIEALPLLRSACPNTVIVAHSAAFSDEAKQLFGVTDGHITKSAFPEGLLNHLHDLCAGSAGSAGI
jgi:CheY-like chemotaxis protein